MNIKNNVSCIGLNRCMYDVTKYNAQKILFQVDSKF